MEYRAEETWSLVGEPDVVVLAGDIHTKGRGVAWAKKVFADIPVVYVLGNHEGWGKAWEHVLAKMREEAQGSNVHILHRNSVQLCGIRFLGATLWTDFSDWPNRQQAYNAASLINHDKYAIGSQDYRKIRTTGFRRLHPRDVLAWNTKDRAFLLHESSQAFDGPTVIVSHHPPVLSALDRPPRDETDAGCANDWEDGVRQINPSAWLYGHIHAPRYLNVGQTLLANHASGHMEEGLPRLFNNAIEVPLDGSPARVIENKFEFFC